MDQGLITVLAMFVANAAIIIPLFIWVRTESRADSRHMEIKLESYRQETQTLLNSFRLETLTMLTAIQEEMKDFHQRLCKIESERR